MNDRVFPGDALARFGEAYPALPARVRHRLLDHPLLTPAALETLALRLRPEDVEYNAAIGLPPGFAPEATPTNGLSIIQTIRSIETCGTWVALKQVQQIPEYRDLLESTLAEVRDKVELITGEMLKLQSFIFLSSPQAVTPLHFDPEYNILLQIRGTKTMTIFRADDDEIATQPFRDGYYDGSHRNLPWREEFAARGREFRLDSGDALYVPVQAPHWVANGNEVSISLSITWRSRWTFEHAEAHRFNKRLRELGLAPTPPRLYPGRNRAKSVAERLLGRVERSLTHS